MAVGDSGLQDLTVQNPSVLLGDILAFSGAIMASGYLIVGSKLREEMDVLPYISMVYTFSAIFLLITSLFLGVSFTGYKQSSYFYMVLLAIVPQLIGHTAFNWALKHLKASMVAITILGEPIGASILAYFIFKEKIQPFQSVGIILFSWPLSFPLEKRKVFVKNVHGVNKNL